jgi:hypothetical protein
MRAHSQTPVRFERSREAAPSMAEELRGLGFARPGVSTSLDTNGEGAVSDD